MIKLLKQLRKREWGMIGVSLIFIVTQVWLDLKMPDYMSAITRLVQTPGSEMSEILLNGGYMLICAVGSMVAAMITGYFAARVAAGLSMTLREKVFKNVMRFESEEIGKFSVSSLITRTTNDITQVQMLVAMGLQAIIKAPILMVWAIVKIAGKEWQWSVATGGAVVVILVVMLAAIFLALPKFKIIQKLTDNLNRVTRENLNGIRVVRAYNAEGYQENKFEKANSELTSTNLFANRVMALLMPTMTFVSSGITLAIYWIGAYLIDEAQMIDRLTVFSDMVVFSSYAMQVIMAFTMLTMTLIMLPRVLVSAKRIREVIETKQSMKYGTKNTSDETGTVEFRNVSFRYPDASDDTLSDINFKVNKGETFAIIGATASGKSSMISLIPRFYDVRIGDILVDGINVKDFDIHVLRSKISFIAQRAILFTGTVASNVAYGNRDAIKSEVENALSIAQAADFVKEMPSDVNSEIAQGGTNVSGGQRQRLSIARAICKMPEIYIFDDSFSALDYKTDKKLRKALANRTGDVTKIIVAQRIGTIRDADRILVLEDGKVVGAGKHEELMKKCEAYREIAYSQLSEEELKNA